MCNIGINSITITIEKIIKYGFGIAALIYSNFWYICRCFWIFREFPEKIISPNLYKYVK